MRDSRALVLYVVTLGLTMAACGVATPAHGASLIVSTTADSGAGSLRQALTDANTNGETDVISFSGLAGQTIAPLSALPMLSVSGTTINGDLGTDCTPDINLSGASAGINTSGISISTAAVGTVIRGIAFHSWNINAINTSSSGTLLECNYFGTDVAGNAVLPNSAVTTGNIFITGSNNVVGPGNLIINGRGVGIRVGEITTNGYPDFVALVSDSVPRVYPTIDFAETCGSVTGSGFTPVDGSGRPFTDNFGIRLRGQINVGSAGDYTFAFGSISGNARLRIDGATIADLQGGNTIPQVVSLGMGTHLLEIDYRAGQGSSRLVPVISGPGSITLTSDGQALCPIGQSGLCAELFQLRIPSVGNRITRNRIRDNASLGIALANCGPYANDAGDPDVGPNGLLNTPLIVALTSLGGGDFNITGSAPPNSTVELFQAAPDATGFGEGASFVAMATATAGGNFSMVTPIAANGALTATATDSGSSTSEFGRTFLYSTGATRLYADAQSESSIELTWVDPDLGETGFRVERSTNGTMFTTVVTLGANANSHLDSGLNAATLYYYRVIATTSSGDAPTSNRATASTFPGSAAKVCFQRFNRDGNFALTPAVAFDGSAWGVAWSERDITRDNIDLVFRRFDATTLAPLAPIVTISDADMNAGALSRLVWNGTHYGLLWSESVRGAAGSPANSPVFFALLDGNGQKVRGNVRLPFPVPSFGEVFELAWDGTHWGVFGLTSDNDPLTELAFYDIFMLRLSADGQATGAPLRLGATAALTEFPVHADWSPEHGHYGVAFVRGRDADYEVLFQRFTATGTPVDANPVVLDSRSFAAGQNGKGSLKVTWDGSAWAVAYGFDDPTNAVETAVWLRRVDALTGLPLDPGPVRLSDVAPDSSDILALFPRAGGGHTAFTETFLPSPLNTVEVTRMQTDGAGQRDGARIFVSPNDGQASLRTSVARGGGDFLVVYSHGTNASLPSELSAVRVAADGLSTPQAPVPITSGHEPLGADIPRSLQTAPLGAGFVGVWTDGTPNAVKINARIWDGAGQIVSTLTPLTASSSRNVIALTSVGNSFALLWKNTANDVIFARYNTSGGTITGERTIATATGAGTNLALRWTGEHYGLFWQFMGGTRYQRVDEAGNTIGTAVSTARALDPLAAVQWLGDSWALVTRIGVTTPGSIEYLRLGLDGALLDGPVALTTPVSTVRGATGQQLHYSGRDLGLAWVDWNGFDPPSEQLMFTVLERNGSKRFTQVAAFNSSSGEFSPRLYSVGANFRVINNSHGFTSGTSEAEITPTGNVLANGRYLTNRTSAIGGGAAIAFNGVTTASFYFPSGLQHLYFHTSACLADATPPPCPTLSTAFAGGAVQASWNAVTDPESSVIRYLLYRDGKPLAEFDADVLSHADGGYESGGPNSYQVRALNGAFVESASCPAQQVDVVGIFADGFESG